MEPAALDDDDEPYDIGHVPDQRHDPLHQIHPSSSESGAPGIIFEDQQSLPRYQHVTSHRLESELAPEDEPSNSATHESLLGPPLEVDGDDLAEATQVSLPRPYHHGSFKGYHHGRDNDHHNNAHQVASPDASQALQSTSHHHLDHNSHQIFDSHQNDHREAKMNEQQLEQNGIERRRHIPKRHVRKVIIPNVQNNSAQIGSGSTRVSPRKSSPSKVKRGVKRAFTRTNRPNFVDQVTELQMPATSNEKGLCRLHAFAYPNNRFSDSRTRCVHCKMCMYCKWGTDCTTPFFHNPSRLLSMGEKITWRQEQIDRALAIGALSEEQHRERQQRIDEERERERERERGKCRSRKRPLSPKAAISSPPVAASIDLVKIASSGATPAQPVQDAPGEFEEQGDKRRKLMALEREQNESRCQEMLKLFQIKDIRPSVCVEENDNQLNADSEEATFAMCKMLAQIISSAAVTSPTTAMSAAFKLALVIALVVIFKRLRARREWLRKYRLGFKGKRPPVGDVIGRVGALRVFPAKSMKEVAVEEASVTDAGLSNDRILMVLNKKGTPVTQRMSPKLARVKVALVPDLKNEGQVLVKLSCLEQDFAQHQLQPIAIDVDSASARIEDAFPVDLHGLAARVVEVAAEESAWIARFLNLTGARLVVLAKDNVRRVHYSAARLLMEDTRPSDSTLLADLAPLSIACSASLDALNSSMENRADNVGPDRFRSNMWIETDLPFIEDEVAEIEVGQARLRNMGPTFRCVIPSVDQSTGEAGFRKNIRSAEPVATLKRCRPGGARYGISGLLPMTMGGSKSLAPLFGIYAGVAQEGQSSVIRVGDPVRVVRYRSPPNPFAAALYWAAESIGLGSASLPT